MEHVDTQPDGRTECTSRLRLALRDAYQQSHKKPSKLNKLPGPPRASLLADVKNAAMTAQVILDVSRKISRGFEILSLGMAKKIHIGRLNRLHRHWLSNRTDELTYITADPEDLEVRYTRTCDVVCNPLVASVLSTKVIWTPENSNITNALTAVSKYAMTILNCTHRQILSQIRTIQCIAEAVDIGGDTEFGVKGDAVHVEETLSILADTLSAGHGPDAHPDAHADNIVPLAMKAALSQVHLVYDIHHLYELIVEAIGRYPQLPRRGGDTHQSESEAHTLPTETGKMYEDVWCCAVRHMYKSSNFVRCLPYSRRTMEWMIEKHTSPKFDDGNTV